jgi:hypothetical protein
MFSVLTILATAIASKQLPIEVEISVFDSVQFIEHRAWLSSPVDTPPAPEFEWRFIWFDPLRLMEAVEDLRSDIPAQRNAPDSVRCLKHFLDRLA